MRDKVLPLSPSYREAIRFSLIQQLPWSLSLDDTQVSDAGLAHLEGLKRLGELRVHKTRVSDAGIEKLHRLLPRVKIIR
jgi:hypothetical protein